MKQYLIASDFDQTLSFHDSGIILSEMLGISGFAEKIAGLSNIHLVQQGGDLAYLVLHDPEYRRVRKEHLIETGKRINAPLLIRSPMAEKSSQASPDGRENDKLDAIGDPIARSFEREMKYA